MADAAQPNRVQYISNEKNVMDGRLPWSCSTACIELESSIEE